MKNNKQGSVLTYVMIAFAVITILIMAVFGILSISVNTVRMSSADRAAYIFAKSGIEYAKSYVMNKRTAGSFIIYGTIDAEIETVQKGTEPQSAKTSPVYTELIVTVDTADSSRLLFTVTSTGSRDNHKETLKYNGVYTTIGSGAAIEVPPIGAGVILASQKPYYWYDNDGYLDNNPKNDTIEGAAIFDAGNDGAFIIRYNNSSGMSTEPDFTSNSMYFLDVPDSVYIDKSFKLRLSADFYYFAGNILGNKSPDFYLNTRNSTLQGNSIGMSDGIYGVFYLAPGAQVKVSNSVIISASPTGRLYYFRNGVNLFKDDLSKVIKETSLADVLAHEGELKTDLNISGAGGMEGRYAD